VNTSSGAPEPGRCSPPAISPRSGRRGLPGLRPRPRRLPGPISLRTGHHTDRLTQSPTAAQRTHPPLHASDSHRAPDETEVVEVMCSHRVQLGVLPCILGRTAGGISLPGLIPAISSTVQVTEHAGSVIYWLQLRNSARRRRPRKARALTVPSGTSRCMAISDWVKRPK
jgi:hypothetical protein